MYQPLFESDADRPPAAQASADADPAGDTAGDTAADPAGDTAPWGRRLSGWQRIVFPGIWLVYLAQTASGIAKHSSGWAAGVGYALLAAFCALYLYAVRYLSFTDWRRFLPLFGGACALTAAETVFAHQDAFVMTVFLAVMLVGTGSRWAMIPLAAMFVLVLAVPPLIPSWDAQPDYTDAFTVIMVSLAMWGFFMILRTNRQLAEARSEVARLAAENERSRIARDLHDLLGHSLTTITVKAGLARRLAEVDPPRAAQEIREVEELTRSTLTDVRAAVTGYRDISLVGQLATGREALRSAGIEARLPRAIDVVDPAWRELFGWVVREGLTNAVRHSGAEAVTIEVGPNWIEVLDDGHGGPADAHGSGLSGLAERVAALHGTVTSGPVGGLITGWRLRVDMPERALPEPPDAPDGAPAPAPADPAPGSGLPPACPEGTVAVRTALGTVLGPSR
jgi:two-component system sensor histidine kinase DesK